MTPYEIHEIIQRDVKRTGATVRELKGMSPTIVRFREGNILGVPPGSYKQEHGIWLLTDQIEP